jgi:phage gp29-like protein
MREVPNTNPNMRVLLGPDGEPIDRLRLMREEAAPTLTGVRTVDAQDPSTGLTPVRLASLLRESEAGDPQSYFELAERIEEKDAHYVSVLRTRKLAASALEPVVEAASDDPQDVAIADFVRDVVTGDAVRTALFDMLDAIGKGISVTEILWDLTGERWVPKKLKWVDPRWIDFDPLDRRTPMLRSQPGELGAGALARPDSRSTPQLKPLAPFKFVVCNIQAKSGLPARSGLARPAAWVYLFKNFDLKNWLQFAEIYGMPLRVGKYHAGATPEEKRTLLRAIASIAADAAAIIPQSMAVEFVEASGNRDGAMFEKFATYCDLQLSKLVLGQTGTTDAVAGGYAVGKVQNEVRIDIRDADALQLAQSLRRDLVEPVVDLNFGPAPNGAKRRYPNLRMASPKTLDVSTMSDALTKLVPLGLEVEASVVRDKLGFGDPKPGAVLLKAPAPALPAPTMPAAMPPATASASSSDALARAFHALASRQAADASDDTTRIAAKLAAAAEPAIAAQLARIEKAVASAGSFDDLSDALLGLAGELSADDFAAAMRDGMTLAHLSGAAAVPAVRPPTARSRRKP